jgi:hypothetical protein
MPPRGGRGPSESPATATDPLLKREDELSALSGATATSLQLNRASLAIMRRLGFRGRGSDGAGVELELPLCQSSRRSRSSSGAWATSEAPRSAERTARKSLVAATS